jgi:acetyltransferase-like isoleucine patch superfamily enzyme
MTINYVKVEKESANDTFVVLRELMAADGGWVEQGDTLLEVEGQKTIYELAARNSGYVYFKQGLEVDSEYDIDEIIGLISDDQLTPDEINNEFGNIQPVNMDEKNSIDLKLPKKRSDQGRIVKRVGIIGGGRGLSQILEINDSLNDQFEIVCVYDDVLFGGLSQKYGIPIVGGVVHEKILDDYDFGFIDGLVISVALHSNRFRKECFDSLSPTIPFVNMVHSSVSLPRKINLGSGNVILPFVHLGMNCRIGDNNYISSYCNIEHHCSLGNHNTFGPNVTMSGGVEIGDSVKFGTGIFLEPKITVQSEQFVKSFQLVNKDI